MFFDDLINMANQCIYTFTYKKLFSNVSPKMESHFKLHLQGLFVKILTKLQDSF